MPLCDLVTPNVPELSLLTSMETEYKVQRDDAVRRLQQQGAKAVMVKGGHLRRGNVDRLYLPEDVSEAYLSTRQRHATHARHGLLAEFRHCRRHGER